MTLTQMIQELQSIRDSIGGDAPVFVPGPNNYGVVLAQEPKCISVIATGADADGDSVRVYKTSEIGNVAAYITHALD